MLTLSVTKTMPPFLFDFNQQLNCNHVTAVLGVSGSGKSTLIQLINGLIKPDNGLITLGDRVLVNTKDNLFIPPENRNIATVFQDALLFPHYRVIKNLTYGSKSKSSQQLDEIIHVLHIEHLLQRYPAMLSGGEKQRVAIGRALLANPSLLLMDEPLSALDMPRKKELLNYIQLLIKKIHIPIVYVTHNINEVKTIANDVIIIEDGKCIEQGQTDDILNSDYLKDWL